MANEKDYIDNLHKGAKPSTFQNALELRHSETEAEKKLWQLLRNRQVKQKKFRRQHAIDNYVLDFYCHECRLAIELDGGIHDLKENRQYDAARKSVLSEYGITVIRFRNEQIMEEVEKVLEKIAEYLIT
ncbi:MAG: endonuclease domain-containing protein [Bacteroidota bacterium]|nr:endonuclease domain-containing protein [Bacteroidota bacterium]